MGALYAGRCFDTATDAAAAMWSGAAPVVGTGSPPVISVVEFASGWQVSSYQGGALLGSVAVPTVSFAACDVSESAVDGASLGWLVALVWIAAWAVSNLRRPLSMR